MQRLFTKHVMSIVLGFLSFNMIAQTPNTLTMNSPSGIVGNYAAARASFGSQTNDPITANAGFVDDGLAPVTDGCTDPTNNLTGLIAFVDRGTCQFGTKAFKAQTKGAIAVIICNNLANSTQGPIIMPAGDDGAKVTVPTYNITYNDCQKIRMDIIAGGANATIQFTCRNTAVYPANTVWGNLPNQGDFTSGLNDWTVDVEPTWEWDSDGLITGNMFGGGTLIGWSGCSGIMNFKSDSLDNNGVPAPQTGALISPTIDLTGQTIDGIVIEWAQLTRQFQSVYKLILSKDGGVSWPDTFIVNGSLPVNSDVISSRERVAVPGYGGITSLKFKFEYVGNYYYWAVDDVIVLNEAKEDIQVNENFYAASASLSTPVSQVAPIAILADVSNIGNKDAGDVTLDYVVVDRSAPTVPVFSASKTYGNVTSGTSVENSVFPVTFTPPATVGTYDASYTIKSANDTGVTGNNRRNMFFYVTEDTYGSVNPEASTNPVNYLPYSLSPWTIGTTVTYYTMANVFHVVNGKDRSVATLSTGLSNADFSLISESGLINADVYEWVDADGDNQCQPTERTKVGTGSVLLDGSIVNTRNFPIDIWGLGQDGGANVGNSFKLKDNTTYIAAVHTAPFEDPTLPRYELLGYSARTFSAFDRSVNYSAQRLAQDSIPALASRSAGSLFGITGTSDADVEDRTFEIISNGSLETTGFIDIKLGPVLSSTYDLDNTTEVTTFPNPASREIFIDVTLKEVSDVTIELIAIDGKVATTRSFGKVQDDRLKMDLADMTSGTYTVLVKTNNGVVSRKIIVQK